MSPHRTSGQGSTAEAPLAGDWRVLAVAAVVVLIEGGGRLGTVAFLGPLVGNLWVVSAVVLWPPVAAVFGLAAVVPTVRRDRDGDGSRADGDGADRPVAQALTNGRTLGALAAVSVGGHLFALVGGSVLFLLVDTPLRYLLYGAGYGDAFTLDVVTFAPFLGTAAGAVVAWVVPAVAVVRVATGTGFSEAVRSAVVAPVTRPRGVATVMAGNLAFVAVLVVGTIATDGAARWVDDLGVAIGPVPAVAVPLALGGLLLVFAGTSWLAWTLTVTVGRHAGPSPAGSTHGEARRSVPVIRLAVVVLLVSTLATAAGAVRVTESSPVDSSPEPLPDEPDDRYATASENTDRASHEYRWRVLDDEDDGPAYWVRVDRDDRRMASALGELSMYASNAVLYNGDRVPLPGYASVNENGVPRLAEPAPDATNWTVVDETDGESTLELTDDEDVVAALDARVVDQHFEDPEFHESVVRMTVDADRKTLSGGEAHLNVTDRADPDEAVDRHYAYEYEYDVDVERPDELGPPGPGELFWRLFAY